MESVYPESITLLGTVSGQEVRKRKRKGAGILTKVFLHTRLSSGITGNMKISVYSN